MAVPKSASVVSSSLWSHLKKAPPDPVFGLIEAFRKDPRPNKVNIGIGVYTDDSGSPFVFPVVRKVEKELKSHRLDKQYAGIMGSPTFRKAAVEFAFGNGFLNCATAQTVAGTAALRVMGSFLQQFYPYPKKVYLSDHTWSNHVNIFRSAGLQVSSYRYLNSRTYGFDSSGTYEDLMKIPEHSIVLFQTCGHNPTGVDPTLDEWSEISRICKERQHFVIMDATYQGFVSGNADQDAAGLRKLAADGNFVAVCQSFSKSMSLYGERVGCVSIVCSSEEERDIVESQMRTVIRPMYSNPPISGVRIAINVLTNPEYKEQWLHELEAAAKHVQYKRWLLYDSLHKQCSTRDWSHVMRQKGWFCFTGMTKAQCETLEKDYAIFVAKNGRIPVVALATKDVDYIAKAIHEVTSQVHC